AIRAKGTKLIVEVLDATSAAAVNALITKLVRTYGRLAGVIHTAMVLDDGLIAGLEPARTRAVLAPKMDGATNLDRATSLNCATGAGPLDYFVVYSSATTMIGNPGQAAYVAANGYLQGLMRRRRADGLPGLAVAWGAIADVGVLARDLDVAVKLERFTGIVPMRADEALSHLDILLARPSICPPTVYCAVFRPGAALQGLKLLETPAFVRLFADAEGSDQEVGIDLAMQIAGKSEVKARAIVARLVASEVARILRLSAEEIDVARPLDELGMDSLMSLELRMSIEKRFGIELPIVAISSGISVNDLAARLFAGLGAGGAAAPAGDAEMRLMMQHGSSDVGLSDLMAVTDAIDTRRAAVTDETNRGRLSRGVKAALLDAMRKAPVGDRPVRGSVVPRASRHDMSFESLPAYQQMQTQRALADALKIGFPFYRAHDVRAGARSVINGKPVVNFASYDYLGFNGRPEITKAVVEAAETWGTSVSASRITAGERQFHRDLERAIADIYDAEDSLVFVSGHATAISTIAALLGPKDLILHDSL